MDNNFFSRETAGDILILTLSTAIVDLERYHLLNQILPEIEKDFKKVVLNLGQVGSLNSLLIGGLIRFHQTFKEKGGKVVICNITEESKETLEFLSLNRLFVLASSQDDAITALER